MKLTREFYVPTVAGTVKVELEELDAVVYLYNIGDSYFGLKAFLGKAVKPELHYRFTTEQKRADYLRGWVESRKIVVERHNERKAERKAARAAFTTSLKVGDILRNSWGYEQTNIDYFEVVEVKPGGKSVLIRKIAQSSEETGFLQGKCSPQPGKFVGEPMLKRVQSGDCVKIHSWGSYAYKCAKDDVSSWSSYA